MRGIRDQKQRKSSGEEQRGVIVWDRAVDSRKRRSGGAKEHRTRKKTKREGAAQNKPRY